MMSGQAAVSILALVFAFPRPVAAQSSGPCGTDRTMSTLVGAGLGGAVAAIPATIVHRHDQTSSHLIVAVSIPAGALIGFVAAGRDRPCLSGTESPHVADAVVAKRSAHARHGGLAGVVSGAVLGAAGGTLYSVGCEREPCNATRANLMLFSAGEGALAGGILGGLIGWAWPVGR
jgi:hypothetical protein